MLSWLDVSEFRWDDAPSPVEADRTAVFRASFWSDADVHNESETKFSKHSVICVIQRK